MSSKPRRTQERSAVRTRKTPRSLATLQAQARKQGTARLTAEEIGADIAAVRARDRLERQLARLRRYGARQVRKLGIKQADVERMIHAYRTEPRS